MVYPISSVSGMVQPCYFFSYLSHSSFPQANQPTRLSRKPVTLFCPGIPGAGIAYLYCDYRHIDNQTVEQLIANLVKQLFRNKFPPPPAVMDAYNRHGKKHRSQPSLSDVEDMFHAVTALYKDGVFVIVDALDECQMSNNVRSKFIKTLLQLQSRGTNVNLLATSRPEPDIMEAFSGYSYLEIIAQKDDIERYIRNRMSDWHVVSNYPDLRDEVVSCIISVADGM
jgi:hypothetical protein